jgi:alpha-galactosidase
MITMPAIAQSTQPAITQSENPTTWKIQTANSQYTIAVAGDNIPVPVYFGPPGDAPLPNLKVDPKVGSKIRELPFRGGFVEQTPAIEVVFADGTRDCQLVYDSSKITQLDGQPTLQINLKDPAYGLRIETFYRVFPDLDIQQRWLVITNTSDKPITLENAQSASVHLPPGEYDLTHLAGEWAREYNPFTAKLTPGVHTIQSRDFTSFANPPWLALRGANNDVYFASLHYSGNWRLDVEKSFTGAAQIIGGINFWDTSVRLSPGEEFTTPKLVVGYAPDGMDGAARRMHDYVRQHVLPAHVRERLRPVLYNSWYATTFNVHEDQQIALAKAANDMGVELFVIDDGWFKGRVNDRAGLGDWTVDEKKFPHGLAPMIKQINDLGMDFGIWVEPEMVNPDSDLYRAHPDWAFHYPNRERHEGRHQYMLNLARQDVYDYLLDSMTRLLKENNIKFIKWDRNRGLSDPGWPDAPPDVQRSVRIRYIENLYKLIDELRTRFPDVLFESCSGGGGRADLGMLQRMDQMWISDNTNPADRLFIQSGYLRMFPGNTMVSWVTDDNWHHAAVSLKYRFNVSMCGVLGVGGNITKWSDTDRKTAAEMISLYKKIRPIIQHGTVHQLLLPQDSDRVALQYISDGRRSSVLFLFTMRDPLTGSTTAERSTRTVHLQGLDPDATYTLTGDLKKTATGKSLMSVGLPWPLYADYTSAVIQLDRN